MTDATPSTFFFLNFYSTAIRQPTSRQFATSITKTDPALIQAEKIKSDFEAQLAEMEASKKKAEAELKSELDKMSSFIAEKKKALVTELEEERAKLLEKTNEEIAQRKEQLVSDIEKELLGVVSKIVLEVVHIKVPAEVIEQSVNDAWKNKSS